jgi:hypothetical protein
MSVESYKPHSPAFRAARLCADKHGRGTRYRVVALASTVDDVVESAGGFVFDHAAAGWEVVVYVEDCRNELPLRIVGASTVRRCSALSLEMEAEPADILLVGASLPIRDPIRRYLALVHDQEIEPAMWGGEPPTQRQRDRRIIEYRLTAAAVAFKREALMTVSVGRTAHLPSTETFHCVGRVPGAWSFIATSS